MLCQNCKINESTIHLYTNVNGKQHQVDLCQNCYQIMKTDPNNALFRGMTNMNNQNNLDPFDDFFNNLGNFQNHQEPQTLRLNLEVVTAMEVTVPIKVGVHASKLRNSLKAS